MTTYSPRVADGQRIPLYFENGRLIHEDGSPATAIVMELVGHEPAFQQLYFDTLPQSLLSQQMSGTCLTCWPGKAIYGKFCETCMKEHLTFTEFAADFFEKDGTWI